MKTLKIGIALLLFTFAIPAQAQTPTVDEILDTYFENIGGLENFKQLQGMKMVAKMTNTPMNMDIPIEMIQLKDGRQMQTITFQETELKQGVFDGETLWNTNFMNRKAEKADAEQTANFKLGTNDFPDSFIDYKEKGYTVELIGTETMDGAETFKVKLVKEPRTVDGIKEEDISFYYFDVDNFVPIAVETKIPAGPMKGQMSKSTMSEYQEVDGLYFPFSMTVPFGPGGDATMVVESIELNPQVDDSVFKFPEEITEEK